MSRLATLQQHWILNLTVEGRMVHPVTILREQVFHEYITDVFPWATIKQKHHITRSFEELPNIWESLCPD